MSYTTDAVIADMNARREAEAEMQMQQFSNGWTHEDMAAFDMEFERNDQNAPRINEYPYFHGAI